VIAHHLSVLLVYGNIRGRRPIAAATESLHPAGDTVPETDASSMGRPRTMATSCSITVVSPHRRWNVCVFEHHRSISVVNAAESIISRSPDMMQASGRNPACRMNDMYRSSHDRGLCVQILSDNSRCVTQQWYKNISPNR
jgi:hypothetical protein